MFSFFHSVVLVYYIVGGLQNKRALPDILNLIEIKWNLLDNFIEVQKTLAIEIYIFCNNSRSVGTLQPLLKSQHIYL